MDSQGHVIPLIPGSKPPSRGIYKMSPMEQDALKLWVTDMLKKGYIVPSVSPFGAPILFVEKPDGSLRLNNNNNKRPLTPKSMPPAGDEHAKLKT